MSLHSQTQSSLTATKYRHVQSHTSSCIPSILPLSFIPPLHLSSQLVQVFPPIPKTSLRIDCLPVFMLNMHRILHLLSSCCSIGHLSLPFSLHPPTSPHLSTLVFLYPCCLCLAQCFRFHTHTIHFCSSLNLSSSSSSSSSTLQFDFSSTTPHHLQPHPLSLSPHVGVRAEWRSRGISSMATFQ